MAVARDHLGKPSADLDALPPGIDAHPQAVWASCHRHLIARTSLIGRATKHLPRELMEKCVVVQPVPNRCLELRLKVAKQGQRLGAHLEAQHMLHERGVRPFGGLRTRRPHPNGLLKLAAALTACPALPLCFRFPSGYPR